jgi:ethanolamine ammonia-lyase large subunit
MARWHCNVGARSHQFDTLAELMAKAAPRRSGDELAGVAAASAEERVAAQFCLADVPLKQYLDEPLVPYETDEVNHGLDQQTCEARAYAVARQFQPLLVNTVAGFIGPEYLYDGKQIIRAALEDHFCGKLLGLHMGVDVCRSSFACVNFVEQCQC